MPLPIWVEAEFFFVVVPAIAAVNRLRSMECQAQELGAVRVLDSFYTFHHHVGFDGVVPVTYFAAAASSIAK